MADHKLNLEMFRQLVQQSMPVLDVERAAYLVTANGIINAAAIFGMTPAAFMEAARAIAPRIGRGRVLHYTRAINMFYEVMVDDHQRNLHMFRQLVWQSMPELDEE